MSYENFLRELVRWMNRSLNSCPPLRSRCSESGFDAVSAQDAWGLDAPGFQGMNLDPAPGKGMNRDAHSQRRSGKILLPFSDGNASIARLLVRKLIPEAIPEIPRRTSLPHAQTTPSWIMNSRQCVSV